jgi:hypothetical protein
VSSNHIPEASAFIQSIQSFYRCLPVYIYNLGLTAAEISSLESLPFVHILPFVSPGNGPLVIRGANAFKAPLIANFIALYHRKAHPYRYFFYGDSTTFIIAKFDLAIFWELERHGIVAEHPIKGAQITFTHPKMYPFFGVDREEEYREGLRGNPSKQVQSGLMMIDCDNKTIVGDFIKRWVDCCVNIECLAPDGAITHKRAPGLSTDPNMTVANGTRVYRSGTLSPSLSPLPLPDLDHLSVSVSLSLRVLPFRLSLLSLLPPPPPGPIATTSRPSPFSSTSISAMG